MSDDAPKQKRLEEQRDNLQLLNQVMRHDIRNDLQLVGAYAELLEGHVDEEGEAYLDVIQRSTENAVDLTTTARDLARVMLNRDAETRSSPLDTVLNHQVEEVRSGYPGAVVTVDGSIPDVEVVGNDMLDSVFRNLLTNAIQHNDKTPPEVTVATDVTAGDVEVRITDNGPGVPDSQKEEIFGKGERGLESSGAGIGLYLVDSLVDMYGGEVSVEDRGDHPLPGSQSRPDDDPEGSVFVVTLPIAE